MTGFAVGDEVYADNLGRKGGFAEFALVPVSALARKPEGLTFEQAASIPPARPDRAPGHGRRAQARGCW
ncbi:MAG: hypothetical protein R2734_12575 [Nocardioides sp.]